MTVQEVARAVMRETKTSQAVIAEKAGLSGQSAVGMYLKSKSMRVENLLTILNACGYELVARCPSGAHPEYVIGQEAGSSVVAIDEARIADMVKKAVAEAFADLKSGEYGKGK